jgi:serine protease AprX
LGGKVKREFRNFPMRVISIPAHVLDRLAEGNGVRFVALDSPVEGFSPAAKTTARLPVPGAPEHLTVSPDVAIAVMDSGVASHPDIALQEHVEVIPSFEEQDPRVMRGLQALYDFDAGAGATIADVSEVGQPLDLTIEDPDRVSWSRETLTIESATRASNETDSNKIFSACTASNEMTVEAWVVAGRTLQDGPARIVTLSLDPYNRNFSLTQDGDRYQFRLRTTTNGANGCYTRLYSAPGTVSTNAMQHVVATRDALGNSALYLDGQLVDTVTIAGDFSDWDPAYDLALGNEFSTYSTTTERDWIGDFDLVAVYCEALTAAEVQQNYLAGSSPVVRHDPFGHGTHVAGMIAGDGTLSSGTHAGVAPGASIYSLRVLDEGGRGFASDVIAGLDWVLTNAAAKNIRVVNLSLGKAVEESASMDPLVQAVESVWDAGITVVCAAGNYGRDGNFTISSPGNSPKVITVGSITDKGTGNDFSDDFTSTYSSQGPTLFDHYLKPDLIAPGNRVIAPTPGKAKLRDDLPENVVACNAPACDYDYLELSGTSMATAVVSGAVSLMLSKDSTLNPPTIKARLMRSTRKIPGDPTEVGTGVLDITAALNETGFLTSAPSPKMGRSDDGAVIHVQDTGLLWGDPAFGAGYMWNDANLWSDSYMWSDGYMWSDANLWSDSYMWSDANLWSDGYMWNDANLWSDACLWSDAVQNSDPLMSESVDGLRLNDDD